MFDFAERGFDCWLRIVSMSYPRAGAATILTFESESRLYGYPS